jgi:hypothetical protein
MRLSKISGLLAFVFMVLACASVRVDATEYLLSEPYTHENLTLHFLQVADQNQTDSNHNKVITLEEAMSKDKVVVYETGNVSQLQVENVSVDETVFIHAGDIVRGGKQDRVITTDMLLQPKSGKLAMGAFCVEQGRWQPRGSESVKEFESSKNRLSSKDLKVAALSKKEQGEVWKEVGDLQRKLQATVQSNVRDSRSQTSLQLSLENEAVTGKVEDYLTALKPTVKKHSKANGYVALINGEISSADVFVSPVLFQKQWPKLILSSATEALAETTVDAQGQVESITTTAPNEILEFLSASEIGKLEEQKIDKAGTVMKNDAEDRFFYESRSSNDAESWVHKGYLKK